MAVDLDAVNGTCRALLQAGADPNTGSANGSPALHTAIRSVRDEKLITQIADAGASLIAKDNHDKSPLALAKGMSADLRTYLRNTRNRQLKQIKALPTNR